MTLTIELTPEQETRLTAAAEKRGMGPAELARQLLAEHLPAAPRKGGHPDATERDPELVARVRSLRGSLAHLGPLTEELHRERQADRAREPR